MKKALAFLLTLVMAFTLIPFSASAYDGTVKDFEFIPSKPFSVYFESDGFIDTDENEQEFYFYNYISYGDGDEFVIIDESDNRTSYSAQWNEEDGEWYFVAENGDRIALTGSEKEIELIDEQDHPDKHLQLGENKNSFFVEYKGIRKAIPVYVELNPVEAFEFVPVSSYEILENTHGDWDYNDDYGDYFNYYSPDFREGDKLFVNFAGEADPVEYTYREVNNEIDFFNENGEALPYADTLSRWKHSSPWTIDGDNTFFVEYSGISVPVSVSIVANTVTAIDYKRAKADEYLEGDTYYDSWDDAYYYRHPNFYEGDVLTVYENEKATAYTCKFDTDTYEYYFESESGERIETTGEDCVSFYDSQRETPWTVGSGNEFFAEYRGQKTTLYATVNENPVASIAYKRVEPAVVYDSEGWENESGNRMYETPSFLYGDTLTVNYKNGTSKTFTFQFSEALEENLFIAEDGESIEDVRTDDNQWETPWSFGEHEYYIEYFGKRTTATVTVKENDIKAIRIELVNPATVYEGTQHEAYSWTTGRTYMAYDIPWFEEGDRLILIDKNGQEKIYTYNPQGDGSFKCGDELLDGMVTVYHYQFNKPWEIDKYNCYYAELRGITCEVPVTVIASDVKSIRFTMSKPEELIFNEHTDGEWMEKDGKRYFAYTWQNKDFVGSTLTVTNKDDTTDVYTLKFDFEGEGAYFENENGDILTTDDVPFWDEQAQEPWTPTAQGRLYMRYKGATCEVPVIIKHSYEKKIIAPTCTEKGRTEYTCTACGDTYVESYTDALGHKWDSGKVTKAATYTATGVKTYTCTVCGEKKTETIPKLEKKANTLSVKAKKPSVKFAKLKKKNQTIALKNWVTVSKAQGKVKYKKSSGNKKITVSKTGKITVKKGLKKGTYKVKIKVAAAGNTAYKPVTKTVTVKITVK